MGTDPERDRRRAEEAERLGITPEELRVRRRAETEAGLERRASETGQPIEKYLSERRKRRKSANDRQAARDANGPRRTRGFQDGPPADDSA